MTVIPISAQRKRAHRVACDEWHVEEGDAEDTTNGRVEGRAWQLGAKRLGEPPQGSFRMRHYARMFDVPAFAWIELIQAASSHPPTPDTAWMDNCELRQHLVWWTPSAYPARGSSFCWYMLLGTKWPSDIDC